MSIENINKVDLRKCDGAISQQCINERHYVCRDESLIDEPCQ